MSLAIVGCRLEPKSPPKAPRPEYYEGDMTFQSLGFRISGTVELGAAPGPTPLREFFLPRMLTSPVGLGWRAGWIQLCCQEEVWGLYRGEAPGDGAMLARWPAGESIDTEARD